MRCSPNDTSTIRGAPASSHRALRLVGDRYGHRVFEPDERRFVGPSDREAIVSGDEMVVSGRSWCAEHDERDAERHASGAESRKGHWVPRVRGT